MAGSANQERACPVSVDQSQGRHLLRLRSTVGHGSRNMCVSDRYSQYRVVSADTKFADLSQLLNNTTLPLAWNVVFVMSLVASTVFFAHSAVRLCMATAPPRVRNRENQLGKRLYDDYDDEDFEYDHQHLIQPLRDFTRMQMSTTAAGYPTTIITPRTGLFASSKMKPLPRTPDTSPVRRSLEHFGTTTVQLGEARALIQPPPPAYGQWRGNVRVDPERLHWR